MNDAVAGWSDEMRSACLYRVLARVEKSAERAELFARKKDHGRAEAALIARFAAETIVGREC